MHILLIDEATHFSPESLKYLMGNLRLGDWRPDFEKIQEHLPFITPGYFPRQILASNPGNIGHNFIKARYIDPHPPMEMWTAPKEHGGMKTIYVQALVTDNYALLENDPSYPDKIRAMGGKNLVKQMLYGDWSVASGSILGDIWDSDIHILPAFDIPDSWTIYRNFDWGSSKPFAVTYHAVSDGTTATLKDGTPRTYPPDTNFMIHEIYGQEGDDPNVGCKKSAREIGVIMHEVEDANKWGERVIPGPGDSQIFEALRGGIVDTIHDQLLIGFNKGMTETTIVHDASFDDVDEEDEYTDAFDIFYGDLGELFVKADKSPGSRVKSLELFRSYLKSSLQDPMEDAGYFIFEHCRHSIRTLPTIPRSEVDPEDADTKSEDHIYDTIRYQLYTKNVRFIQMDVKGI